MMRSPSPTSAPAQPAPPPFSAPPEPKQPLQPLPTERVVRRTLKLSVIEGGATQIFLNWTTGSVLIGYLLYIGASSTVIGLIASVPLLAQLMSPLAAYVAGMLGKRKALTIIMSTIGRGIWLFAAFLPQLGVPDTLLSPVMVMLVLVSSIFQASAGTLWAAWMGDVVPDAQRGRYFGMRAGIVGVVGMLANLAAGWYLDRVAAPLNFQTVLAVAVLCALISSVLYVFHYEPPSSESRFSLRATLSEPWADPNFRQFLMFALYWQFAVLLASPFVFPYFIGELRMSFTQIAIWSGIASSCALITTAQWGRLADRVGNKSVLAIGTVLAGAALPACWIAAGLSGRLGFIWISAVFDALAWGAIGPAMFNLALASAPRVKRMAFIATFSMITGASGFLGGLLSGPLLLSLKALTFDLGDLHISEYHLLFTLSGLFRIQAWRLLRPVQESNAWRTRDVLRSVRPWPRLGFPWRN